MSTSLIRAGVIGTGLRAATYFKNLPEELRPRVQLVALADPNEKHRRAFAEKFSASADARFYESGQELLQNEELDALVIGSPNFAHANDAIIALQKRIPILLEKPVVTTFEDCKRLWQAYVENGKPPVTVGFVLRYTPFYGRIKSLLEENAVAQILTIDSDENIGTGVTELFFAGWRRWSKMAGPFIVEKCSHDFDILRDLTGSEAARVMSFERRTHFVADPPGGRLPRFENRENTLGALDYSDSETQKLFNATEKTSLYDISDGDLPDHQTVMIEWENGALTCFTAAFAQPYTTRRIRVAGANGAIEGDVLRSLIRHTAPDETGTGTSREYSIPHDDSGHHGGDSIIASQFWNSCLLPSASRAGLREGIEAVLIGLAAAQSSQSGAPVAVDPLRSEVFGDDL